MNTGVVRRITRTAGQGGDVAYYVKVQAQQGDICQMVLSGNMFAGPVVLVGVGDGGRRYEEVVPHPRRFGEFASAEWIHRFFQSRQHRLLENDAVAERCDDIA